MKKFLLSTIFLGGLFTSQLSAALTNIADSVADFSGTQGSNNWYYGFRTDDDGGLGGGWGGFTQLPVFAVTQWRQPDWNGGGYADGPYTMLSSTTSTPDEGIYSQTGGYEFSARRWVAQVTDTLTITGTVQKLYIGDGSPGDSGDGFVFGILNNGTQVARIGGLDYLGVNDGFSNFFTGGNAASGYTYSLILSVVAGDNIEFVQGSFATLNSDSAKFTATILQDVAVIPEPSALAMCGIGLVGACLLIGRNRRRDLARS